MSIAAYITGVRVENDYTSNEDITHYRFELTGSWTWLGIGGGGQEARILTKIQGIRLVEKIYADKDVVETLNRAYLTDSARSAVVRIYHYRDNPTRPEWLESVHDGIKSNNLYSLPRV